MLPPHLQLPQRRDQVPSTGAEIGCDAAVGGIGHWFLVGAVGCFLAMRGRERVNDTSRPRLDHDGQAAVNLCM